MKTWYTIHAAREAIERDYLILGSEPGNDEEQETLAVVFGTLDWVLGVNGIDADCLGPAIPNAIAVAIDQAIARAAAARAATKSSASKV